MGQFIKNYY